MFHATDSTFVPTPGPTPQVFVQSNVTQVPPGRFRSVGRIEVTVRERDAERAGEKAAEKGRELGCWILIEHTAFEGMGRRAHLDHRAFVVLAHGGLSGDVHSPHVHRADRTTVFDCVVTDAPVATASST